MLAKGIHERDQLSTRIGQFRCAFSPNGSHCWRQSTKKCIIKDNIKGLFESVLEKVCQDEVDIGYGAFGLHLFSFGNRCWS